MAYSRGAVERAMKVQEVILRAIDGKLTWVQAADILGYSPRTIRRIRWRLQHYGYDGLLDRRRQTPSPKRAPVAEVQRLLALYRERYLGFNVRHFHQFARREHGVRFCYAFVKKALQTAGLVAKHQPRGRHRRRREPRACFGELLHLDGSRHRWLALRPEQWFTLIAVVDDATKRLLYAQLREGGESVAAILTALRAVLEHDGVPMALYTDRAHWAVHTPTSGSAPIASTRPRSAARWPGWASNTSWAIRPRRAAAASAPTAPCKTASSTNCVPPASPQWPRPIAMCATASCPPSTPSSAGRRPLPPPPLCRWAASISTRSSASRTNAPSGATTSRPRTACRCSSPNNPAAARAPGCGSWSAAISAASTPSGMAPAASVVMTLPASRSGRPEPVRFIERPTHGVKQLRPSHVSATAPKATSPRRAAQSRIEHIAQRVAEHVEPEDGQRDRHPGPHGHPRRAEHVRAARAREHRAPRREGRRHAETEERERRLRQDCGAEPDRRQDDDRRHDVGQDVAGDDARVAAAERAGRLDVRRLGHRDRGAADHARVDRGDEDGERDHEVEKPGAEDGHDREDDHQIREGQPRVDEPLDHEVVGPAEVAARHADHRREEDREADRRKAHRDRHACAVDDAAPHVAGEVIRAEPVGGARRLHARTADRLIVVVGRDPLGERRHHQHRDDDQGAERAERLAPREPPDASQRSRERDGPVAFERGLRPRPLGWAAFARGLCPRLPQWGRWTGRHRGPLRFSIGFADRGRPRARRRPG